MANYFVVNSKFKPYSFDEMLKPYALYNQVYKEQEQELNNILEKAASLEDLSPTIDSAAYNSYQTWKENLKTASDQLATSGLNNTLKSNIVNLGRTFRSDYLPLVSKLTKRGELVKEQRDYLQKHPNAFFDTDYSTVPIENIGVNSTYNTYDLDEIAKSVLSDAYGKLSSGNEVDSTEDYLGRYGEGVTDENDRNKIIQAINSGKTLAEANYKQKEFENYLNKVRTFRSGSRSGGSGYPTSGTPRASTVNAYDGTAIDVNYDKKVGEYQIKNKDKKDVTLPKDYTAEDVLKAYYGGDYQYINTLNISIPRIKTTETDANGNTREVYTVWTGNKWQIFPEGEKTPKRDLYKAIYGKDLLGLTDADKQGLPFDESVLQEHLNHRNEKKRWSEEDISDSYRDYAGTIIPEKVIEKMDALEKVGANFHVTLYRSEKKKDGSRDAVGYKIVGENDQPGAPIETQWGK